MTNQNVRPWQGTVLGVLQIIGLVFFSLLLVPFLLLVVAGGVMMGGAAVEGASASPEMLSALPAFLTGGVMLAVLGLLFVGIFILEIFVTVGVFKGKKWAIIVALVFSSLGALNLLSDFSAFSALITGFAIYLEIMCLQHPFYNKIKA